MSAVLSESSLAEQTASRVYSGLELRALELLGQNIHPSQVAAALGCTESLISQYLADSEFVARVAELRFKTLARHNARDLEYDSLEDQLIRQIKSFIPMVMDPMKLAKLIQVINAAKRRGSAAPESLIQKSEVISLTLPIQIVNQFTVNSNNQVVKAGEQNLVTIQSGRLNTLLSNKLSQGDPNVVPSLPAPNVSTSESLGSGGA